MRSEDKGRPGNPHPRRRRRRCTFGRPMPTTPKYAVEQVMKIAHMSEEEGSKDPTLFARVADGKATKEDKAKLLELYSALPKDKPPQGDADAWKDKTKAYRGSDAGRRRWQGWRKRNSKPPPTAWRATWSSRVRRSKRYKLNGEPGA